MITGNVRFAILICKRSTSNKISELIIVEDLSAGVCPQCGEKVVKADVGRWIASLLDNSELIAQAPRITVPIIKHNTEK